jgi:hypothetical protein
MKRRWNRVLGTLRRLWMKSPQKDDAFRNDMDISGALRGWNFQPGQINVRLIRGSNGKPKLQLRLDLGLLQMELDGRPDGKRPHRVASELEYLTRKLRTHESRYHSEAGFALTARDCQALREESAMFYHRYLSLFVLEQYAAVIRDTQHNLDVLDLCHRFGRSEYDRMCLEQYRPYILMMNIRAKACDALRQGYVRTAIAYLRGGIRKIAATFPREQRRNLLRQSNEARILLDMIKQIRAQLPPDPRDLLKNRLKEALAAERYEEAADLRDQLLAMTTAMIEPDVPARREEDPTPASEAGLPGGMPKAALPARRPRKPRSRKSSRPDAE